MKEKEIQNLIQCAEAARERSYSPYSGYMVGAALLTEEGKIVTGCNIENAAFGPSNCAERTAFFKAISEGLLKFRAIAIVGGRQAGERDYAHPCGVCRQVMAEFCNPDSFLIIVGKSEVDYQIYTLRELLPNSFGPDNVS